MTSNATSELNLLVAQAQGGDQRALEDVVSAIQDQVHHLAVRMLVNLEDARDATQDILILVITKLSTFRGESSFRTWVYRVAAHYLLDTKRRRAPQLTFDAFEADLEDGLVADPAPMADEIELLNELRVSCTMAMLLCLDVPHRVAYVLGDVLELDHTEAAQILGISKVNYRKRLSRARADVVAFTSRACGLASDQASCNCPRRLPAAVGLGRVRRDRYVVAGTPSYEVVRQQARTLEGELKVLTLQRATSLYRSPVDFGAEVKRLVSGITHHQPNGGTTVDADAVE
jgi:RNA polymerase sigma factor (sigma-70 family)